MSYLPTAPYILFYPWGLSFPGFEFGCHYWLKGIFFLIDAEALCRQTAAWPRGADEGFWAHGRNRMKVGSEMHE